MLSECKFYLQSISLHYSFFCLQTLVQMGMYIKSYLNVLTALVIEN